jgi:choline dehydrogenase-like flavoprotein
VRTRRLTDDVPDRVDVIVIGSGPAGMTVAAELSARGVDVLVVESGPHAEELNRIESVGQARVEPQRLVRRREVGGSSAAWSGRCTPLDAIDFEAREWVAGSGWPLTPDDLAPFMQRASTILGLGESEYGAGVWPLLGLPAPAALDGSLLQERFWQFSRGRQHPEAPTRFSTDLPTEAALLSGATATRLIHADGRVTAVEIAATDGTRARVEASTVVIAGGAIESPRLLLASGLGSDSTGRYLMDHPGVVIGSLTRTGMDALRDRFGLYWRAAEPFRLAYLNGIALSPELQRRERLLNAACWLDEYPAADDPWQAGLRLAARIRGSRAAVDEEAVEYWRDGATAAPPSAVRDVMSVLRHPVLLLRGLARLRRNRPPLYLSDRIDLYALVEQLPDPESRVTLSDAVDAIGMPIARVDWRLHPEEHRSVVRLAELVRQELARLGLSAPLPADGLEDVELWRGRVHDRAHQIGTTRMATDASSGVVDTDCLVFGTSNVYVAGSSVFPTSGHANPTLTIVALAVRLAEHLASARGTDRG